MIVATKEDAEGTVSRRAPPITNYQLPTTALLVRHSLLTLHDAPNNVALLAAALQDELRLLELLGRHHQHHANAHVEGAQHFVARHVADLFHVLEDGRHRPGMYLDDCAHALGQNPRQVVSDAATGDVRHGRH